MMQGRGKLPVEPLSEQTWNRVREEIFAELEATDATDRFRSVDAPRRHWRSLAGWLVAAVLACVAAFAFISRSGGPMQATATSRIATAESITRATVGDATVEVAPESELLVTGGESLGFTVVLERGDVAFSVPKRGNRAPFRVQAGDVRVEVVGTQFKVSRNGQHVRVGVTHGSVRVILRGETVLLDEGDHWESPAESPSTRAPGVSEPAPTSSMPSNVSPEPASAKHSDIGQRRIATAHGGRAVAAADSATPSTEMTLAPSARAHYEGASRLEVSDPDRATGLYLELADEGGVWGANALYAAGRLELERGRRERARQLLERYLRKFPNGPNAQDAQLLLRRAK